MSGGWGYGMTDGGWELLRRFHAHLRDVWSLLALSIRGGWVEDASGLTCVATGSTSPSFNPALSGRNLVDPRSALDGASERYRAAGLRWLLKLQPDLDREMIAYAQGRGIEFDEEPVYRLSLSTWADSARPSPSLSIVTASTDTIDDAGSCVAEAFEADPRDVRRELGQNLLTVPSFTVFIGYLSGEPVATSMLATTPGVRLAGIYSVATRPPFRGRGLGTALTAAALSAGRAQGYDIAVLEPSPMGAAVYRRMGFEPFGTYLQAVMDPSETESAHG
jgi:GNAT superfamily N-acetyltransferase